MAPGAQRKIGVSLALCVAALAASAWGFSQQPAWKKQYQEAVLQLRQGNADMAERQFKACWKSYPRDFVLANAIGAALDGAGHHRRATLWYQRAIQANPRFLPAYNNLALSYAVRGELDRAVPPLTRAIQLDPGNEEAFFNLGLVRMQMGQNGAAATDLERAHVLAPRNPAILPDLAVAYLRSGQRPRGLQVIEEWVGLSGDQPEAVLQAVRILNGAGLYRDALARAEGLEKTGGFTLALALEKADALFHLGRYKETVNVLEGEGREIPHSVNYDLLLGSSQALAGELPDAVKTFQIAVREAPRNPQPYYRLALVLMQGYRGHDALQVLSAGLQQMPNSALLWYAKGVVDEMDGRYRNAVDSLDRSLSVMPDQARVWSMLGELYVRMGDYPKAMTSYKAAMGYGSAPDTAAKYAELLIQFHRLRDAAAVLRQSSAKYPSDASLYRGWGEWYSAEKQYGRAEAFFRRSIELNRSSYESHFVLAHTLERLGKPDAAKQEFATAARIKKRTSEPAHLLKRRLAPLQSSPNP